MFRDYYESYCKRHGDPEHGYQVNMPSAGEESRALTKVIVDKYFKTRAGGKSGDDASANSQTQYAEDLDLTPCILGAWEPAKEAPHIYMKYEGGDLFKVCMIVPAFSYDIPSDGKDSIERVKLILYPPKDNRVHYVYLDGSPSPNIGPCHGYNVVCTYIHYLELGIDAFCDCIDIYCSIFCDRKPESETDLIYAAVLTRVLFMRSLYPINSRPLPWTAAENYLKKQIKKR